MKRIFATGDTTGVVLYSDNWKKQYIIRVSQSLHTLITIQNILSDLGRGLERSNHYITSSRWIHVSLPPRKRKKK